jgi:aminoglycoside phosphotransferase (APT) family kinase protein
MSGERTSSRSTPLRPPVALMTTQATDETIATVNALERSGQAVTLIWLDESAEPPQDLLADVVRLPTVSAAGFASLFRMAMRTPSRVAGAVLRHPLPSRVSTLAHLAGVLESRGVASVRGLDPRASRIAQTIERLARLRAPDLSGLNLDWARIGAREVTVRWISRRINSVVAEVSVDGARAIVKRQYAHGGESVERRFHQELRVLRELELLFQQDPAIAVPHVLMEDAVTTTVLLERARGVPLDSLFATATRAGGLDVLQRALHGAGRWLARMQERTSIGEEGSVVLQQVIDVARRDLKTVAVSDARLGREESRIEEALVRLAARSEKRSLRVCGHHDDYAPMNIFSDGEVVTVIDFESYRAGLPLEDVAFFLLRAEMLRRRFRLPDLSEWFLAGYGKDIDREALQLFTITKALRMLVRGVGEGTSFVQRWWLQTMVRRALLRAVEGEA